MMSAGRYRSVPRRSRCVARAATPHHSFALNSVRYGVTYIVKLQPPNPYPAKTSHHRAGSLKPNFPPLKPLSQQTVILVFTTAIFRHGR